MIVYNVKRRWFAKWVDADAYRRAEGLRPSEALKVTVEHRDELVALLEALCSPSEPSKPVKAPATPELLDRAYVETGKDIPDCVPAFLRRAHGLEP